MRSAVGTLTPRGRGVMLLGLLLVAVGIAARYPVPVGLGGGLLLLVLSEAAAVAGSREITVHREISSPVVMRHGECRGRIVVDAALRRGLVRLDVADRVDGVLVTVHLPGESSADTTSVDYDVPTTRRGLLDVGPVQVRRCGLTGMASRTSEAGTVDQVRVLPRRVPVAEVARGTRRAALGGDDSIEQGGTDLVGLHTYTMGEDLRRLHWATSARTGTLMVREDAEPAEPHVAVLLDDRRSGYAGHDDLFEEAVEIANALCCTAIERGHPVRLVLLSGRDTVVVPGSLSRQPGREARDLEWLLAEVDLDERAGVGRADLATEGHPDVAVAVTGPHGSQTDLALLVAGAATAAVLVAEPASISPPPLPSAGGPLVLRGSTSDALAAAWDAAVPR